MGHGCVQVPGCVEGHPCINKLEKWTLENGFTISKNKSVAMHFCPDKKCMDPVLKLDNDPIQFVKEAKFLGLIWDTKLTFEPHIKYLKARCQKITEYPQSPFSYRIGCRSNNFIEIVSLPG